MGTGSSASGTGIGRGGQGAGDTRKEVIVCRLSHMGMATQLSDLDAISSWHLPHGSDAHVDIQDLNHVPQFSQMETDG